MRFASALSWRESEKVEIVMWSAGNLPRSMGLSRNNSITEFLESEHLPLAQSEAALSALAFYREGVSLDNPFYSFLSLYKAFTFMYIGILARWFIFCRGIRGYTKCAERRSPAQLLP